MSMRMDSSPHLSQDLLVKVLSYVQLHQRLGSCSLVCRGWRSAAAAATPDISITLQLQDTTTRLDQRSRSLAPWLTKHGGQVSSLKLACTECDGWPGGFWYPDDDVPAPLNLDLPCRQLGQLHQLSLSGVMLLPDAAGYAAAADDSSTSRRVTRSSTTCRGSRGRGSTSQQQQQQQHLGPEFLSGLSSLVSLQLTDCSISGWHLGLAGLSGLTQLQRLQLELKIAGAPKNHNTQLVSMGLGAALPHLSHLTYLSVKERGLEAAALQGLRKLQQLRELHLEDCLQGSKLCKVMQQTLAHLPTSLTVLHIHATWWGKHERGPPVVLDSSNTARLQALSSLVQLEVPGMVVHDVTGLLGGLSQLTSLNLGDDWVPEGGPVPDAPWAMLQQLRELRVGVGKVDLLQGLPPSLTHLELSWNGSELLSSATAPSIAQLTALHHLWVEEYQGHLLCVCPSISQYMQQLRYLELSGITRDGLPVLLAALDSMQQLQHLMLHGDGVAALQGHAMQQYAALTASSQLTRLDLLYDEHIMADGAAQYMFAEGKQLPHLKVLQLGVEDWDCSAYPEVFGDGDLAQLAAACPALEQFWALPSISVSADITDLALLTSVTDLKVGGFDLCAAELTAALLKMSQLVDLQVTGVDYFDASELAALTQLTGLRHLMVQAKDDQSLLDDHDVVSLHSRATPPDVWQQLRELCLEDSLGTAAIQQLEQQQLQQQMAQEQQQEQRPESSEQRLDES